MRALASCAAVAVATTFGLMTTTFKAEGAPLTNDFSALTEAGACKDVCPANFIHSFGDLSYGAADPGNGFDSAESANFQDHFGLFARGSANSTADPGHGSGWAYGNFLLSVLIPSDPTHPAGSVGSFMLPYHLNGTVTIDWGEVFSGGFLVSGATARLVWDATSFNIDGSSNTTQHLADDTWSGNKLSVTVNRNVTWSVPFRFGTIFYLSEGYYVSVDGHSGAAPSVGFVEADFLHTALLGPAIVKDGSGNILINPTILSDTGFDFAHPAANVPEPSALALFVAGLACVATLASRRIHDA